VILRSTTTCQTTENLSIPRFPPPAGRGWTRAEDVVVSSLCSPDLDLLQAKACSWASHCVSAHAFFSSLFFLSFSYFFFVLCCQPRGREHPSADSSKTYMQLSGRRPCGSAVLGAHRHQLDACPCAPGLGTHDAFFLPARFADLIGPFHPPPTTLHPHSSLCPWQNKRKNDGRYLRLDTRHHPTRKKGNVGIPRWMRRCCCSCVRGPVPARGPLANPFGCAGRTHWRALPDNARLYSLCGLSSLMIVLSLFFQRT
ncbi:hypothetical protein MAPG_03996, partial [Magnaporthiopsis poae ATCC 64411]|uniref:Uncharacterized protein n=1 Tax=Magnaporthiopsis poae (strain ATCC 64411 / 73-15) TaxID=644358 RepID=A0A0C4DVJ0_MAGP6